MPLQIHTLSVVTPIKMYWCNNESHTRCVCNANRVALGVARALDLGSADSYVLECNAITQAQ